MDADFVCKIFKIFNLATVKAVLIKVVTIVYIHKVFQKLERNSKSLRERKQKASYAITDLFY